MVSRQPECPACPHEHHILRCDINGCECSDPPLPGGLSVESDDHY